MRTNLHFYDARYNLTCPVRIKMGLFELLNVLLLGVTTLSVEGWLPRRSERANKVGEERGEARGVPINANCGRTVKWWSKW